MLPTELFLEPASRHTTALLFALAYAIVCAAVIWREHKHRQKFVAVESAASGSPACLVAYASQTGTAEEIALHAAQRLNLAGVSAHLTPLDALDLGTLQRCERALFIVSTYGEGNAPDNAAGFEATVMESIVCLPQLHCGVLALGDATYAEYCGFGRRLDEWLSSTGVQALFPRIEVDRGNAEALGAWQQQLTHLAGSSDAPDWAAPAFESWQLQSRRLLNPGSTGSPLFEICLAPVLDDAPMWESGDLVQIQIPEDAARPRDYSIASLPEEGKVQLLVRLSQGENGYIGKASGWLAQAPVGATVPLRLRPHRLFRLGENAERPLILIGNGSGLAGLLGHLKARVAAGQTRNWLIYGERNAATDTLYHDELQGWLTSGHVQRLERVFSRDGNALRYVQDAIQQSATELRRWVDDGAAIYVCGSLEGMAAGVDQALQAVLSEAEVNTLKLTGRYRRDVY